MLSLWNCGQHLFVVHNSTGFMTPKTAALYPRIPPGNPECFELGSSHTNSPWPESIYIAGRTDRMWQCLPDEPKLGQSPARVGGIRLPDNDEDAAKFVREAIPN